MATELIINLSEPREKRMLLDLVRSLEGMQRIEICKHRQRRSDRQNRYYWPCFVAPFGEWLREQGENLTDDEAHEILKTRFLRKTVIDKATGEAMDYTQSTTKLDTQEFNTYLEQCAQFLAEYCHIVVPDANVYREAA